MNLSILTKAIFFLLLIVGVSCQKEEEAVPTMPEVGISGALSLNQTSGLARGTLSEVDKSKADEYGIVWGQTPGPDISSNKKSFPYTIGVYVFSSQLENLTLGQTYYVRTYVRSGSEVIYSETVSFIHQGPFVWRPLPPVTWSDRQHTTYSTSVNGGIFVLRPISQRDTEVWLFIPRSDLWLNRPNLDLPSTRYDPLLITLNKFGSDASFMASG